MNLYNVYIHSTQTDIFQVFISFNFDDYKWKLMKTPNVSSVKFPQSVMVWGGHVICWCGSTVFSEVQGHTAVYQEVLEHFMLPAADQLYGDADFIFQQDLAPAHSAKATSTWFKDHGIPVLNWPANSPDLNPIENLWGIVKRRCDMPDPTMQKSWRPLSEQPGLS